MNVNKITAAVIALLGLAGAAQATIVSGNFNASGYDVFSINVAAPAAVDFQFLSGYGDPTISLFNAAGTHLITNDDSNGLYFHLTQNLAVGDYSVLVSYCCNVLNALPGYSYTYSDGFNSGSYYFGTGTLAGMTGYLNGSNNASGAAYSLRMTNAALGNTVPEPGSLALAGLALLGLGLSRRRA